MNREETIEYDIEEFIHDFNRSIKKKEMEVPEITDDVITKILKEYFNKKTLSEADKYFYDVFTEYVKGDYNSINWGLGREEAEKTPEYKAWKRQCNIETIWSDIYRCLAIRNVWVDVNGKAHTEEEAATIAADKWCELIFNWHMQDNGALNEDYPGGFPACALGTVLANDARENVTEEMKVKAHALFREYYLRAMHYHKTFDDDDKKWLEENLPDETGKFDWKYGFYDLSCDYDPSWPLYLILLHSGISDRDCCNLCPWKTSITIRQEDNAVMYHTYQHCEQL